MPFILDNPSTDGQLSVIELHNLLEACKKVCPQVNAIILQTLNLIARTFALLVGNRDISIIIVFL